jgi:hypothetical protein
LALALAILGSAPPVAAVQLPGLPPPLPPGIDRKFELLFANDFLGRGGTIDDFRTQQLGVVGAIAEEWTLIVDHSILTFEGPELSDHGRVDHLSMSVGYELVKIRGPSHVQTVEVGGGFRYSGEMGGAKMQNGFHQIVGSKPSALPYVSTDRVDGTLWLRLPRYGTLKKGARLPGLGEGWDFLYWGRASTLLTTDAEWDGSVGLSAVATKGWFQLWVGVQGDWRTGHDRDPVSRETADFEEGAGGILGLRLGPFLIETLQGFDGEAAYGHLSLVSTGQGLKTLVSDSHSLSLQTGLEIPDVLATLQGRWSNCRLLGCSENWRRTVVLDFRYGKPQFRSEVDTYVATRQATISFELEKAPWPGHEWLTAFSALGGGWRIERLEEANHIVGGERSKTVGRAGLVSDLGLRLGTSAASSSLNLMLQIGLSGWIPGSGGTVEFGGEAKRLQRPGLALAFGAVLRYDPGNR